MSLISYVFILCQWWNEKKYAIDADLGQDVLFQIWDYDAGLPGSENDDFLGRFWSIFFYFIFLHVFPNFYLKSNSVCVCLLTSFFSLSNFASISSCFVCWTVWVLLTFRLFIKFHFQNVTHYAILSMYDTSAGVHRGRSAPNNQVPKLPLLHLLLPFHTSLYCNLPHQFTLPSIAPSPYHPPPSTT